MKRIQQFANHLHTSATKHNEFCIGDVCITHNGSGGVPLGVFDVINDKEVLEHLQWIMKKDILGQNIMLIGRPGPFKRRLVKTYLALKQQGMETIVLHPDTSSESDLKQRREIKSRKDGTLQLNWNDSPLVRAAIQGKTVLIEGVERAERNVLPVLNNLLENREMNLEDGRRIVSHETYDHLLHYPGLLRAHENFRIIALTAPTPTYKGKALDPPFRSRFQARFVDTPVQGTPITKNHKKYLGQDFQESDIISKLNFIRQTLSLAKRDAKQTILNTLLPEFDQSTIEKCRLLRKVFPLEFKKDLYLGISRYYSSSWISRELSKEQENSFQTLLRTFDLPFDKSNHSNLDFAKRTQYSFLKVENKLAHFQSNDTFETIPIVINEKKAPDFPSAYVNSPRCNDVLSRMIQCHILNQDFLLIGPKSSSKSICIREFAKILNYELNVFYLYKDLTARDLLQRRSTRADGSTFWEDSILVKSAKCGHLVVLEGLHWITSSISVTLSSLVHDRELTLPDGTHLVDMATFEEMKQELKVSGLDLNQKGIYSIHPSFRIIATVTADPPNTKKLNFDWYTEEVGAMFAFLQVDPMGQREEKKLLQSVNCPKERLDLIANFAGRLQSLNQSSGRASVLSNSILVSTRQLLRIAKRASFDNSDLYSIIWNASLGPFMSSIARNALTQLLNNAGIRKTKPKSFQIKNGHNQISFGEVILQKFTSDDEESKSLVPFSDKDSTFFDNDTHSSVMRDLAIDFSFGEHLLLIGNQGVGKNKIVDRFLELLKYPREYIQLHRDTTVQSLLFQPILKEGKIIYMDSPLLKAIKFGRVIMIDEADKAPVHVISVIKSLAEDRAINLPDGRRILDKNHCRSSTDVPIHCNFRMIVLANRPGFPFLGNDFYSSIGEAFSCHPVENPGYQSEVTLLQQLAPSVKQIPQLVGAFQDLRAMFDDNLVQYPYSLRELINIVKHMEMFPNENLESVLRNVFDFDAHRPELSEMLLSAFKSQGLVINKIGASAIDIKSSDDLAIKYGGKAPADIIDPKEGKVDPNNDPHVGGNTWAGGTGGSSTAGLGGRGGPFRLDSGNPIHQLPDSLKSQVPQKVLDAARQQGKDALEKRLKEIHMSAEQEQLFSELYKNIQSQIQQLRIVLELIEAKEKERVWIRNQNDGELDETKLVEGVTGETALYKKRAEEDNNFGNQELPKRLKFVFDVSGSMFRFNQYDKRLTKSLETALMIMEALKGLEHKFKYDIVGHSGDSDNIEFVESGKPPKDEKQMLQVLSYMMAHSQYCWSGDNTLRAANRAVDEVTKGDKADDYFVIIISDANLRRYAIDPMDLAKILDRNPEVSACILMIGSLGDEAKEIIEKMPKGKAFMTSSSSQIPQLLREIFLAAMSK